METGHTFFQWVCREDILHGQCWTEDRKQDSVSTLAHAVASPPDFCCPLLSRTIFAPSCYLKTTSSHISKANILIRNDDISFEEKFSLCLFAPDPHSGLAVEMSWAGACPCLPWNPTHTWKLQRLEGRG